MTIEDTTQEPIWAQRYRPQTIEETILPDNIKKVFQKFVEEKEVPNLLLSGPPGTGKTTVATAMLKELGCDYIIINGSMDGGIDTLRHKIANFASSVSFSGGRKYVIIDEADGMTVQAQMSARNFIELYSKNCGFIWTCNSKNKISQPLHSRFSIIDFTIETEQKPKMAMMFFKRVVNILEKENIEYNKAVVAKVIEKHFPDFRRILGELQTYSKTGKIDEGIFIDIGKESVDELFVMLKEKNFEGMRKWCAQNSGIDANDLFRKIYDVSAEKIELKSMPGFVVSLGEYSYKNALVADPEINMAAFLTEIMFEATFK